MNAVLASVPIVVALLLLLLRAGAVPAGAAALTSAVLVAWLGFDVSAADVVTGQAEFAPVYLEVALILLGGVLLSRLLAVTGAQQRLGEWVTGVCADPARAVLLVVLGLVPFVESVTGFGVGAVIGVPLLVQFGFARARAAVLGLLGLVIVPWGSLGPGTLVAAKLSGVEFQQLGVYSAVLSLPVFLLSGGAAVLLGVGARRAVTVLPELVVVLVALWGGVWAVNTVVGTPLAGLLGSLFALAVVLTLARVREGGSLRLSRRTARDLLPYLLLIIGLLTATLGVTAASVADTGWATVLTSPALWLLTTCVATPTLLGRSLRTGVPAVPQALRRWWPVAVTTVLFLAMGTLLAGSGMSAALATAASRLDAAYPAVAPWVGGLGGFITGSNTGASAMFATSQAQTAQAIGYPMLTMVALQNVAASLTTMAAIPKVVLAGTLARDTPAPTWHTPPRASGSRERHATGITTTVDDTAVRVGTGQVLRVVLTVDIVILVVLSAVALLWPV